MLRDLFSDPNKLGLAPAWLYPLWIGGGLLAILLLGFVVRGPLRRALSGLKELRHPLSEHLFQIACGAIFLLLFVDFVGLALARDPDFKVLTGLATLLLVLALGAQYGQHLFARLKKLGPLELFEKEVPELIERLREVLDPLDVEIEKALSTPISPAAEHAYQSATALLQHIEFSGDRPSSERNRKRYGDLLFKFSQLASKRQDWWAARRSLEQLRGLLGAEFEAFKVAYNLGRAYLECADSGAPDRDELRHKALSCFAEATKRSPFDAESFFWLAYVQDDLGMLDLAIASNRKVLERRHGYSLAKYNIVISRIKKGELEQALADLLAITPRDEAGLETLRGATADPELRPLLQDPVQGGRARWWLEYHQDPSRFPD